MDDYDRFEEDEPLQQAPRRSRPPIGPAGLSLLGGAILLAVCAAILGLSANNTVQINDIKGRQDTTCVNMNTLNVYNNAVRQAIAGSFPSDSTIAVGNDVDGGRVVAMVNTVAMIYRKSTMELLYQNTLAALFGNIVTGDIYVTYDSISDRFFASVFFVNQCAQGINVSAPLSLAGTQCMGTATFGAVNYSIGDTAVVNSIPQNGCTPFTNAAAVNGTIVLIQRGGCTFVVKAANAYAAGAIAMITYNNVGTIEIQRMGGSSTVPIPCVSVGQTLGNAMYAASPGLSLSLTDINITATSNTLFSVVVSTNSAPSSDADFYAFPTFTTPLWTNVIGDFPKHTVTADAFFLATNDFDANIDYIGAHIGAFDKANMLSGTSVDFLWEEVFPQQPFLMPAQQRMPIGGFNQPAYFVGMSIPLPGESEYLMSAMSVFSATYDGMTSLTPVRVPITPVEFPSGDFFPPAMRQPPPAPLGLESLGGFSTAVVSKGSLWCTLTHNVSTVRTTVRWMEMDISTTWSNGDITLVQEGDINQSPDLDVAFPAIDIDRDGNMMIAFTVSGPNQFPSIGYTGRLASDEKGALRYPISIFAQGNSSYLADVTGRNRWGDYTGGMFDPVDRKTFWMFAQIPDPNGLFNVNGSAIQWTSTIGTARIDARGDCPANPKTHAQVKKINLKAEERYANLHPSPYPPQAPEEKDGPKTDDE